MATRGTLRASEANPFQWIPFQVADHFAPDRPTGGGATEFVPVTAEYRAALVQSLATAAEALRPEVNKYPGTPGVLILKLREQAVAKSHRPNTLVAESSLELAGMARLDEMLVAANAVSIQSFSDVIERRNTKLIRANLSAVQSIGAWDVARRLDESIANLRRHGSALLSLFRYAGADANALVLDTLRRLLRRYGIPERTVPQRWGTPLFKLDFGSLTEDQADGLISFPGLRSIMRDPTVELLATAGGAAGGALTSPAANLAYPVIGVVDSGVSPEAVSLRPWVIRTISSVLPPDTDYFHGTAVASLGKV